MKLVFRLLLLHALNCLWTLFYPFLERVLVDVVNNYRRKGNCFIGGNYI